MDFRMKKLLIILLFASLNVSASDWIEMGTLTSGSIFYLDKSSIMKEGDQFKVWTKHNVDNNSDFEDASDFIDLVQYSCKDRKEITLISSQFNKKGELSYYHTEVLDVNHREWNNIMPDTFPEKVYEYLCKN